MPGAMLGARLWPKGMRVRNISSRVKRVWSATSRDPFRTVLRLRD